MIRWFRSPIAIKAAAGVFALLMLIFVLTFVDWGALARGTSVGKVNGRSLDARVYEQAVREATERRQRQVNQSLGLDDEQAIRDQVWNEFVTEQLLRSEYRRRHIRVTADEVAAAVENRPLPEFYRSPEFQTDSQFDPVKYQKWLRSSVAQQFLPAMEAQYRDALEREKLFRALVADVYLPESALWARYRDEHEKVKIDLAAIVPAHVVPDSAVPVTPAEVEAYYRAHRKELERPRTIFSSFVAVPRLPDASDTAAARARAEQLRKEIAGGAPFAEVARRESADTASGHRGGDLGEWTKGTFDPRFDSVAFSIPLNTVSEPVLSQFGFHLIEVTSRKGNRAKGRHILIPIEITGRHRDRLDAIADSLDRLAADRLDPAALDTVARALGLTIGRAEPLVAGQKMQVGVLRLPDAGAWAAQAKPGQISPIIETPFAMYLFRVDSIRPPGIPPLAQIRDQVAALVRAEKKRVEARKIGQTLVARLDAGAPLAKAAGELKLPHEVFGPFARVGAPLRSPVVIGAAFGTPVGKHSGLLDTPDGYYVLQVLDHTPADSAAFVKDLDKFRAEALEQAREERVQTYLAGLRSTADVVDQRSKLLPGAQPAPAGS